jgi:hypothetical protein
MMVEDLPFLSHEMLCPVQQFLKLTFWRANLAVAPSNGPLKGALSVLVVGQFIRFRWSLSFQAFSNYEPLLCSTVH